MSARTHHSKWWWIEPTLGTGIHPDRNEAFTEILPAQAPLPKLADGTQAAPVRIVHHRASAASTGHPSNEDSTLLFDVIMVLRRPAAVPPSVKWCRSTL